MKTISDYRAEMLVILGDTAGRRYTEPVLDMSLRQALQTLQRYLPRREMVTVRVSEVRDGQAVVSGFPAGDAEVISVRDKDGKWLNASVYRTGGKLYIQSCGPEMSPEAGDLLKLELAGPYTVKGLAGESQTTVPESLTLTVCTGAAACAMQIRARSVTEVFGKRPEDSLHLMRQAEALTGVFRADLQGRARMEYLWSDPWETPGFPI